MELKRKVEREERAPRQLLSISKSLSAKSKIFYIFYDSSVFIFFPVFPAAFMLYFHVPPEKFLMFHV